MKRIPIVAVLLLLLVAAGACKKDEETITVMTRNVYVGADVDRVIAASTPEELVERVLVAWQEVQATDFTRRAQALAAEIADHKPDIVGLQEITLFRMQDPGDAAVGGTTQATDIVYDYLELLRQALLSRGLEYRIGGVVQDADVEMPLLTGVNPMTFADIRMTDFDAVLVSEDVDILDAEERSYEAALEVPMPGGATLRIPRGYVSLDVDVRGTRFRFLSSHLEPAAAEPLLSLQVAQAAELAQATGAGAAIVVGDLNSPATTGASYGLLRDAGLRDAWSDAGDGSNGFTCCFDTLLLPGGRTPDSRLDLVLFRSDAVTTFVAESARRVGTDPSSLAGGMYPSDHIGLVARFRVEEK